MKLSLSAPLPHPTCEEAIVNHKLQGILTDIHFTRPQGIGFRTPSTGLPPCSASIDDDTISPDADTHGSSGSRRPQLPDPATATLNNHLSPSPRDPSKPALAVSVGGGGRGGELARLACTLGCDPDCDPGPNYDSYNHIDWAIEARDGQPGGLISYETCMAALQTEHGGCESGSEQYHSGFWFRIDPNSGKCPGT